MAVCRRSRKSRVVLTCLVGFSVCIGYNYFTTHKVRHLQGRIEIHDIRTRDFFSSPKSTDRDYFVGTFSSPQDRMDCLTNGQWERNDSVSREQYETVDKVIRLHRDYLGLPTPLQRSDNRCGEISFSSSMFTYHLTWFRAVCDPHQSTPCCDYGICKNLTEEECRCENCYDLRQDLYAELSVWKNNDNRCQVYSLTKDDICKGLDIKHLVLIGDSHMRHTYFGLQKLLDEELVPSDREDLEEKCKDFAKYRTDCREFSNSEVTACGGKLKISLQEWFHPVYSKEILNTIHSLLNKPGSVVIMNLGHHAHFNYELIRSAVTAPMLDMIENSGNSWPKVIWAGGHSMGTMKSPTHPNQTNSHIVKFNESLRRFVSQRGVTFFDWYNLTRNLASADGSHFHIAANELKAAVLVNFLIGVRGVNNLPDFTSKQKIIRDV